MESNVKNNLFRALGSNSISILASVFVIIILPKFIGLEEYSYWQLYLFYASYVGFLHLGWTDGFYLINAGKRLSEIDPKRASANYYSFILCQLLLTVIILLLSLYFESEYSKVVFYTAICLLLTNIRSYSQFLLQATSRIKDYSNIIIIEKITLFTGILIAIALFEVTYEVIILIDIFSRFIALLLSSFRCKEILYSSAINYKAIKFGFEDSLQYVFSGFKLMFSFICGLLIFGAVRYTIEMKWGLLVFGEVSLALSLATLFVVFINSIGIVLFPMLRNITEEVRKLVYTRIRFFLFFLLVFFCNLYFPLYGFISVWLPEFENSLIYLSLIFPVMLFEAKISILINSYMKAMREESALLKGNLFILALSITFCLIIYYWIDSAKNCLIVLVLLSFLRYVYFDNFLSRIMGVVNYKYWFFDVSFVIYFIYISNSKFWFMYPVVTISILPLLIYRIRKYKK